MALTQVRRVGGSKNNAAYYMEHAPHFWTF